MENKLIDQLNKPYEPPRKDLSIHGYVPMLIIIFITLLYTESEHLILYMMVDICKWFYYIIGSALMLGLFILINAFSNTEFRDEYWNKFKGEPPWDKPKSIGKKCIHVINNLIHWAFLGYVFIYLKDYYLSAALILLEFFGFLYKIVVQASYYEFKAIPNIEENDAEG